MLQTNHLAVILAAAAAFVWAPHGWTHAGDGLVKVLLIASILGVWHAR
jgi:hypothetical protein